MSRHLGELDNVKLRIRVGERRKKNRPRAVQGLTFTIQKIVKCILNDVLKLQCGEGHVCLQFIVIIRILIELERLVVILEPFFNFLSKCVFVMWKTYLVLAQIRTSTKKCFFVGAY